MFLPIYLNMVSNNYSFELKSDLSELESLCQNLNKFGQDTGVSADDIKDINVCLDELFTNIVSYGFEDSEVHIIKFTLKLDKNVLTMIVEDDGIPFNPLERGNPELPQELNDAKIGGLGIHIVRKFMDDICYKRVRNHNNLKLTKLISIDPQLSSQ